MVFQSILSFLVSAVFSREKSENSTFFAFNHRKGLEIAWLVFVVLQLNLVRPVENIAGQGIIPSFLSFFGHRKLTKWTSVLILRRLYNLTGFSMVGKCNVNSISKKPSKKLLTLDRFNGCVFVTSFKSLSFRMVFLLFSVIQWHFNVEPKVKPC